MSWFEVSEIAFALKANADYIRFMIEVTRLLDAAQAGDRQAAAKLLPLVYEELRKLATARIENEKPGQTLQATALVHEAYLRLVGDQQFDNRGHFFAAAAEAMRRILVENARRKGRLRHGGDRNRVTALEDPPAKLNPVEDVIAVSEALDKLAAVDAQASELVNLHFFAGLTIEESAAVLGASARKGYTIWAYARAWLYRAMGGNAEPEM